MVVSQQDRPTVMGTGDQTLHEQVPDLNSRDTSPERMNTTIGGGASHQTHRRPLLELCDEVRYNLREHKGLGSDGEELLDFLGRAVKGEHDGTPIITFEILKDARLDKLLSDMTNKDNHSEYATVENLAQFTVAESLQRQWKARFRESYFGIDHARQYRLTEPRGRLENIIFKSCGSNNVGSWGAKKCESLSESERNARFKEGCWWLNLACAYRDGIVTSSSESFSQSRYETPALPLLRGIEVTSWPGSTIKYIRDGRMCDMHTPLISHVGFKIRILRGHRLKSPFAPKAGVRYDGEYIIRQYGQRRIPETGTFRLSLVLDRVEGQRPMEELRCIPRPSELDDWQLYEKLEGEMVKQNYGCVRFLEWNIAKTQDRIERENYERTLRAELSAARANEHEEEADGEREQAVAENELDKKLNNTARGR